MKTRNLNPFRRSQKSSPRRSSQRRARFFRPVTVETLEDRRLLAANAINGVPVSTNALAAFTGFLPIGVDRKDFLEGINLPSTGSGSGGNQLRQTSGLTSSGEGAGGFTNINEVEPNNGIAVATPVPLGFDNNEFTNVVVVGTLTAGDLDVFRVELNAGDILSAKIDSIGPPITPPVSVNSVGLLDSTGAVVMGSSQNLTFIHPAGSPLRAANLVGGTINGVNAALSYVIPTAGTYYVQASSFISIAGEEYTLELEVFRPVLEQQQDNNHQILFLDFNGAFIDTGIFTSGGVGGSAFLSPLSTFIPNWGLTAADENAVINAIVQNVQRAFNDVASNGNNPNFQIEIRNSRDHADPFGLPNVSRVIVGGTIQELFIPTIGIAESIDIGNFDTAETAVVLLDLLSISNPADPLFPNSLNGIPRVTPSIIPLIGTAVGNIVSHEAGHFFGGWHQNQTNNVPVLMDQGGNLANTIGLGPDGVFGTADDITVNFGPPDQFVPNEGFFGIEDVRNAMAFGLTSGATPAPIPARVRGVKFLDRDGDGVRDANEPGVPGFVIYDDVNNNNRLDGLEPRVTTAADGTFELLLASGTHRIREVQQFNWTQTFPTANGGAHVLQLTTGQIRNNINFGNRAAPVTISGVKFNDINGNGVQDVGELGLGGFHIYVDYNNDGRLGAGEPAAITNNNGAYTINNVDPTTFVVREAARAGFIQTFPANGAGHSITALPGDQITGVDFGNQAALDFGDAPASYGTLLANNGARHAILPGFHLGPSATAPINPGVGVDRENDGFPTADASGDDLDQVDDEDGITFGGPLFAGQTNNVTVTVTTSGMAAGVLRLWIDLNGDGVFNPSELLVNDLVLPAGVHVVPIPIPATSNPVGNTFLRARYGVDRNVGPTGLAGAGEVEDHVVQVLADIPLANDDTFSVNQNDFQVALNVLGNDVPSSAGSIAVTAITVPPNQGGTVTIGVGGQNVLYTPRANFAGTETFTYRIQDGAGATDTATVTVTVVPVFTAPIAVDDTMVVAPTGATTINVLANDTLGANTPTTISGVGVNPINTGTRTILGPQNGTAQIVGGTVTYTPNNGFVGSDQFTYTIRDSSLPVPQTSTAVVTVHVQGSDADDLMRLRLEVTNLAGQPITQVAPGSQFLLRLHVLDLRTTDPDPRPGVDGRGVFAAFADILFDGQLASVNRVSGGTTDIAITPGASYPSFAAPLPNIDTPNLIDELGLFATNQMPLGPQERLLLSVQMTASVGASAGSILEFKSDPADALPFHNSLLYTRNNALGVSEIQFTTTSVTIGNPPPEGEFHNAFNRYDVNNDGFVAPDDALAVINDLNFNGARALNFTGEGETNARPATGMYVDVSNDRFVAPDDVLMVINYLNAAPAAAPPEGEGEGDAAIPAVLLAADTNIAVDSSVGLALAAAPETAPLAPASDAPNNDDAAAQSRTVDAVLADANIDHRAGLRSVSVRELLSSTDDDQEQTQLESLIDDLADDVSGVWVE